MRRWTDPVPALKRQLADEILFLTNRWRQADAACLMEITQSRVSDLRRGRLDTISLERMIQCASRLQRVVELKTRQGPGWSRHPHRELDEQITRQGPEGRGSRSAQVSRTG